ncbi:Thioredoxin, putative [Trypanosoma equiperdum]|uniref:Thioredoxin domain-containing protein n=2 Tax=Trypanozoon TaxID=39700 RepID=Q38BK3_TRYB2|nr:hypothetical protein, conserved [Trypanosoma brucei brucei TREU927]EAN77817.1 hypothetical protein, conserved [Trypanosoma brucei brucei TREU927]SCU70985.1 Thioredoxin, putative [Trypanosoma equiperdum]
MVGASSKRPREHETAVEPILAGSFSGGNVSKKSFNGTVVAETDNKSLGVTATLLRDVDFNSQSSMKRSVSNNSNMVGSQNDDSNDECEGEVCELFKSPAQLGGKLQVGVDSRPDVPVSNGQKTLLHAECTNSTASVDGAITTLHTLQQLKELFHTPPVQLEAQAKAPLLQLCAGETVFVVLHSNKEEIEGMLGNVTKKLSACRIFCLDLSALPLAERSGAGAQITPNSASVDRVGDVILQRVTKILDLNSLLNGTPSAEGPSQSLSIKHSSAGAQVEFENVASSAQSSAKDEICHHELTLPSMVMWRVAGGPVDEYGDITAMGSYEAIQSEVGSVPPYGKPLVVKELQTVDQLHSLSLLAPVYTVEHLLRKIGETVLFPPGNDTPSGTHTFIYMGASWCPPCMRVVASLPTMMKEGFPHSFACVVKADMDFAEPLYKFFGVEIIPTFILLNNDVLKGAGDWSAFLKGSGKCMGTCLEQLREGLRRSKMGQIQNSKVPLIQSFIDNHTKGLSFDEEF